MRGAKGNAGIQVAIAIIFLVLAEKASLSSREAISLTST